MSLFEGNYGQRRLRVSLRKETASVGFHWVFIAPMNDAPFWIAIHTLRAPTPYSSNAKAAMRDVDEANVFHSASYSS
jgi:hypothetical protein